MILPLLEGTTVIQVVVVRVRVRLGCCCCCHSPVSMTTTQHKNKEQEGQPGGLEGPPEPSPSPRKVRETRAQRQQHEPQALLEATGGSCDRIHLTQKHRFSTPPPPERQPPQVAAPLRQTVKNSSEQHAENVSHKRFLTLRSVCACV